MAGSKFVLLLLLHDIQIVILYVYKLYVNCMIHTDCLFIYSYIFIYVLHLVCSSD